MANQKYQGICERIHDSISAAVALCGKHFANVSTDFSLISITKSQPIQTIDQLTSSSQSKEKENQEIRSFYNSEWSVYVLNTGHVFYLTTSRINKTFYFHFKTPVLLLQPITHLLLLYLFGVSVFYNSVKSNPALFCCLVQLLWKQCLASEMPGIKKKGKTFMATAL